MPLNEPLKIERKKAEIYPPLPKDIYQVELLDINSELRPTYDTRNSPKEVQEFETVLNFQFTILDHRELRGRNIWANFIPSYLYVSKKNGKNKLFKIIEALVGHELTQAEEAKADNIFLTSLIGNQVRLSVGPVTKGDRTYDNISDFIPAYDKLVSLTEEEKDKAKVRAKPGQKKLPGEGEQEDYEAKSSDISVDEIPF